MIVLTTDTRSAVGLSLVCRWTNSGSSLQTEMIDWLFLAAQTDSFTRRKPNKMWREPGGRRC